MCRRWSWLDGGTPFANGLVSMCDLGLSRRRSFRSLRADTQCTSRHHAEDHDGHRETHTPEKQTAPQTLRFVRLWIGL